MNENIQNSGPSMLLEEGIQVSRTSYVVWDSHQPRANRLTIVGTKCRQNWEQLSNMLRHLTL